MKRGQFTNQDKMLQTANDLMMLNKNQNILEIADFYIKNKAMPQVLEGDAIHLAIASYFKMNFLITWNYKHLANVNKMSHIRILNARLGLSMPEIVTPLQLMNDEGEKNEME